MINTIYSLSTQYCRRLSSCIRSVQLFRHHIRPCTFLFLRTVTKIVMVRPFRLAYWRAKGNPGIFGAGAGEPEEGAFESAASLAMSLTSVVISDEILSASELHTWKPISQNPAGLKSDGRDSGCVGLRSRLRARLQISDELRDITSHGQAVRCNLGDVGAIALEKLPLTTSQSISKDTARTRW